MSSLIIGALGGWIFTLQALKVVNSYIVAAEVFFVLLPQRDTLEIMMLIADFQWIKFC